MLSGGCEFGQHWFRQSVIFSLVLWFFHVFVWGIDQILSIWVLWAMKNFCTARPITTFKDFSNKIFSRSFWPMGFKVGETDCSGNGQKHYLNMCWHITNLLYCGTNLCAFPVWILVILLFDVSDIYIFEINYGDHVAVRLFDTMTLCFKSHTWKGHVLTP